jgi:hypothetical protein
VKTRAQRVVRALRIVAIDLFRNRSKSFLHR